MFWKWGRGSWCLWRVCWQCWCLQVAPEDWLSWLLSEEGCRWKAFHPFPLPPQTQREQWPGWTLGRQKKMPGFALPCFSLCWQRLHLVPVSHQPATEALEMCSQVPLRAMALSKKQGRLSFVLTGKRLELLWCPQGSQWLSVPHTKIWGLHQHNRGSGLFPSFLLPHWVPCPLHQQTCHRNFWKEGLHTLVTQFKPPVLLLPTSSTFFPCSYYSKPCYKAELHVVSWVNPQCMMFLSSKYPFSSVLSLF